MASKVKRDLNLVLAQQKEQHAVEHLLGHALAMYKARQDGLEMTGMGLQLVKYALAYGAAFEEHELKRRNK